MTVLEPLGYRALLVVEAECTSDRWAAYALRYAHPDFDAEPRGTFKLHRHGLVMDPLDVRGAQTWLARRRGRPVGTLRLTCVDGLGEADEVLWTLAHRMNRPVEAVVETSGLVSRIAIDATDVDWTEVLSTLLASVEETARLAGLEALVVRWPTGDEPRRALAGFGYGSLTDGVGFKPIGGGLSGGPIGILNPPNPGPARPTSVPTEETLRRETTTTVLHPANPLPIIRRKPDVRDQIRDLGTLLEVLLKSLYPNVRGPNGGPATLGPLVDRAFDRSAFGALPERDVRFAVRCRNQVTHSRAGARPLDDAALGRARDYLMRAVHELLHQVTPDLALAVEADPHAIDDTLELHLIDALGDPRRATVELGRRLEGLLALADQQEGQPPYRLHGDGAYDVQVWQRIERHHLKLTRVSLSDLKEAVRVAEELRDRPESALDLGIDQLSRLQGAMRLAVLALESSLQVPAETSASSEAVARDEPTPLPSARPRPESSPRARWTSGRRLVPIGVGLALLVVLSYAVPRIAEAREARAQADRDAWRERTLASLESDLARLDGWLVTPPEPPARSQELERAEQRWKELRGTGTTLSRAIGGLKTELAQSPIASSDERRDWEARVERAYASSLEGGDLEAFQREVQDVVDDFSAATEDVKARERVLRDIEQSRTSWLEQLDAASARLDENETYQGPGAAQVERAFGQLRRELRDSLAELERRLTEVARRLDIERPDTRSEAEALSSDWRAALDPPAGEPADELLSAIDRLHEERRERIADLCAAQRERLVHVARDLVDGFARLPEIMEASSVGYDLDPRSLQALPEGYGYEHEPGPYLALDERRTELRAELRRHAAELERLHGRLDDPDLLSDAAEEALTRAVEQAAGAWSERLPALEAEARAVTGELEALASTTRDRFQRFIEDRETAHREAQWFVTAADGEPVFVRDRTHREQLTKAGVPPWIHDGHAGPDAGMGRTWHKKIVEGYNSGFRACDECWKYVDFAMDHWARTIDFSKADTSERQSELEAALLVALRRHAGLEVPREAVSVTWKPRVGGTDARTNHFEGLYDNAEQETFRIRVDVPAMPPEFRARTDEDWTAEAQRIGALLEG